MSPWKFDDLSAGGSKGDIGSPGTSQERHNLYFTESPASVRKYKMSNEKSSFRLKSPIKLEKMQTALSNHEKSPCSSGEGTPDLISGPTIYSRLKNSED